MKPKAILYPYISQANDGRSAAVPNRSGFCGDFHSHSRRQDRHSTVKMVHKKGISRGVETSFGNQLASAIQFVEILDQWCSFDESQPLLARRLRGTPDGICPIKRSRRIEEQHFTFTNACGQLVDHVGRSLGRGHEGQIARLKSHLTFRSRGHAHVGPRWPMDSHSPAVRTFNAKSSAHLAEHVGRR